MSEESGTTIIEVAIWDFLKEDTIINTLVDNNIFPGELPDPPPLPAITYSLISRYSVRDLSGAIYWQSRFQFSCWSDRYGGAKTLAKAVSSVFESYIGEIGSFKILDSTMANETDLNQPDSDLYQVSIDVLIKHK